MTTRRFTGAAAVARLEEKKRLQEAKASLSPPVVIPKLEPPPSLDEIDKTLSYLKEKTFKALIHHTACQTISLSLQEAYNINIPEIMKRCNVKTPTELFQLLGFDFDENDCFQYLGSGGCSSQSQTSKPQYVAAPCLPRF